MTNEVLVIKIFDQEYKIKLGDQDPAYIKELSKFVDAKIREFQQTFPNLDFQKLLLVVCLNLADELFKTKEMSGEITAEEIEQKLLSIKKLLLEESV